MHLVPSVEWQGKRIRAVGNRIFWRDPKETFHTFIIRFLQGTMGVEWWERNKTRTGQNQHVVLRWLHSFDRWAKAMQTDTNKVAENTWTATPNGDTQALMSLAYDVFCLSHTQKLPDELIERLRNHDQFQGVRYEIAVAAIFERSGFDIEWTKDVPGQKRCEFIATHRETKTQIAVEAKSRHREGVLNRKGIYVPTLESENGMRKLYRDARAKEPKMPYIIFMDVNMPPAPEIVPTEFLMWFPALKKVITSYPDPTPEHPTPYNYMIVTNFSYYYAGEDIPHGNVERLWVQSPLPRFALNPSMEEIIEKQLQRYSHVPQEV